MDKIAIALTDDAALRVYAAVTTELVKTAQSIHNTYPVATVALGRVLTAGVMMSAMEKNPDTKLTVSFKGGGPIGSIVAVTEKNTRRGYAAVPDVQSTDVGSAVGKSGFLSVVKDFGSKEPYSSQVRLVSGEIAEDLTYYYALSEQIPTAIALGVSADTLFAGGYVIQLMPGHGENDENTINEIENKIKILPPVNVMVAEGSTAEDIISRVLGDISYSILGFAEPKYQCSCSRERVTRVLAAMGKDELQSLIDDGNGANINCHFCCESYNFTTDELVSCFAAI